MANPSFLIENAVRYFMNQWANGFQPSLLIKTQAHSPAQPFLQSRRSGQFLRQRRKIRRSEVSSKAETYVPSPNTEGSTLHIKENAEDATTLPEVGQASQIRSFLMCLHPCLKLPI